METKLFVFGHNGYGRLGLGDVGNHRSTPTELVHKQPIFTIACGAGHNLLIGGNFLKKISTNTLADNSVWSWGKCHFGQLGHGLEDKDESEPLQIDPLCFGIDVRIVQVSCGDSHCLAVSQTGQLWTWGGKNRRFFVKNNEKAVFTDLWVTETNRINSNQRKSNFLTIKLLNKLKVDLHILSYSIVLFFK
jgi:alpha-tubulin suppressor-like RCC1 family protein